MFGQLKVLNHKLFSAHTPRHQPILPSDIFCFAARAGPSDERGSEAFKAPLNAGGGRLIDAVQRLELLGAQLVVSHAVLPVEGLCRFKRFKSPMIV